MVPGDEGTPGPTQKDDYVQAVAEHMTGVGFVYDSSDDMARLMLITSYAGTKYGEGLFLGTEPHMSTSKGRIFLNDGPDAEDTDDDVYSRIRSEGTYYRVGDSTTPLAQNAGLAVGTKPVQVYSYMDDGSDEFLGDDNDVKTYIVLATSSTDNATGVTTYHWTQIDTMAGADPDEFAPRAALPEKTGYEHIHFGVWAGLGDADKDTGAQDLDDLGIAFVHNYSGTGMTATMPNHGAATYTAIGPRPCRPRIRTATAASRFRAAALSWRRTSV